MFLCPRSHVDGAVQHFGACGAQGRLLPLDGTRGAPDDRARMSHLLALGEQLPAM